MERLTDRIVGTMAAVLDSLSVDESGLEVDFDASLVNSVSVYHLSPGPVVVQEAAIMFIMNVSDPVSGERMTGTFTSELPVVTDEFVADVTHNLWYRVRSNLHLSLLGFQDEYDEALGQEG